MKKPNEISACNASVRVFNALTGFQYRIGRWPDEENRSSEDVECILVSDAQQAPEIAVEHTIVEPFEGENEYVKESHAIIEYINVKCAGRIPGDRYYFLVLPLRLVKSLRRKARERLVETISLWVAGTAPGLQIDDDAETDYEGHRIWLMCSGSGPGMNGNVWRIPTKPEDCERLWVHRLERAIKDKLPKLSKYKDNGFETALLLEDISGSLRDLGQQDKARTCIQGLVGAEVDYIIVFASRNERMVVGTVWKEKSVWFPQDRVFSCCKDNQI